MAEVAVQDGRRIVNHRPVARPDLAEGPASHFLQRLEIGGHVAVWRGYDHCRTRHHVVTREEQSGARKLEAKVVRGVTGRPHCIDGEIADVETVSVRHAEIRSKTLVVAVEMVASPRIARCSRGWAEADYGRSSSRRKTAGKGRMIQVRMGN
jgi:hypothetical protein